MATRVYLVPGFFGFTSLGSLNYFYGVSEALERALAARGIEADIVECRTKPTGSIRRRAEQLLEEVEATGGLEAGELHFVGHSTGGLDVRLLLTPGVRLRHGDAERRLGELTRTVVTVATPHFGTPIAGFFTTVAGRQLLQILAVLATTTGGRYAIFAATKLLRSWARLDDRWGWDKTFLDMLAERLMSRLSTDRADPVWDFLRDVAADQGAIIQLTPESMHLFNAAVTDRDDIQYGSVVTAAPPPPRHYEVKDLLSPSRVATASAFTVMHTLTGREHGQYRYPHPGEAAIAELGAELPFDIDARTNDGVVPTLSQLYGDTLDLVSADHLDVVGQYPGAGGNPHSDWLPSKAPFDRERFEAVWARVADRIARRSVEAAM